jgi:hydroxylamine reductase
MNMFCYQCEQTDQGKGCKTKGVCGKEPEISGLQDVIVYQLKGIGWLAHQARRLGQTRDSINHFTLEAL